MTVDELSLCESLIKHRNNETLCENIVQAHIHALSRLYHFMETLYTEESVIAVGEQRRGSKTRSQMRLIHGI